MKSSPLLLQHIAKTNVLVIPSGRLRRTPQAVLSEVLTFLDLPAEAARCGTVDAKDNIEAAVKQRFPSKHVWLPVFYFRCFPPSSLLSYCAQISQKVRAGGSPVIMHPCRLT